MGLNPIETVFFLLRNAPDRPGNECYFIMRNNYGKNAGWPGISFPVIYLLDFSDGNVISGMPNAAEKIIPL